MGVVKDYFSFSKRERMGVIVLVSIIMVIFVLPEFIPSSRSVSGLEVLSDFSKATDSLGRETSKSTGAFSDHEPFRRREENFKENRGSGKPVHLFYFDPNTISKDGWIELGISERTAGTIEKFLSKGGTFKEPEDIGKIYGLSRAHYDRLLPYVRINNPVRIEEPRKHLPFNDSRKDKSRATQNVVDINTADTAMLIALPGIGSKLATRIINFRNRLGGFYSIEQVKEVYGLPDSTYQMIRPLLSVSLGVQKIDVNEATLEQLKGHPYLRWNIANAIINYRIQHGRFEKLDDLLQIDIMTAETFERMKPYLAVIGSSN